MTTTTDTAKQQIAGGLAISIISAASAYYNGKTDHDAFDKVQKGAWFVAKDQEVEHLLFEALRSAVIDAANACDPRNRDTRVAAIAAYRAVARAYHDALAAVERA